MEDLQDYDTVAEFGPVTKHEKVVRTPGWPEDEAECRKVQYECGDRRWKVARISTLGWSVTEYGEDGRVKRRASSEFGGYFDDAETAHETAKAWVQEYVSE